MNDIQKEISELWNEAFAKASEKSIELAWERNFLKLLNDQEKAANKEALELLEPWVSILNEGIQWLAQLHVALELAKNDDIDQNNEILAPSALVGSACVHCVAVRRLILSGLDSSARVLLRTIIENLNICIAVIYDIELANKFRAVQDFKAAKNFWNQELSFRKLNHILSNIENNIGIMEWEVRQLKGWREDSFSLLSQYVHPSYVASCLSAHPPSMARPIRHRSGLLGQTSCMSVLTLSEVCKTIWYFSRIGIDVLMQLAKQKGEGTPLWSAFQGENGAAFIMGRDIYSKLILRHWNEDNVPDIFEDENETD